MLPTPAPHRARRHGRATIILLLAFTATPAAAVVRTCGPDAAQNTAEVLCAPPSGPCTGTTITLGTNVEVPESPGCVFDLGGRDFVVRRTLEVTGERLGLDGRIVVRNAGRIHVLRSGKLKARGDFVQPNGFIIGGGSIELVGDADVEIDGVLDVTGDPAGQVVIEAAEDLTLGGNGRIRAHGASSFLDEGERFADGGFVFLQSDTRSVEIHGAISLSGQSLGSGGELEVVAARNALVAHKLTARGNDGGVVRVIAGDDVTVTRSIDIDGTGDGFGGEIDIEAGNEHLFDAKPGGDVLVEGISINMRGNGLDGFGGDGGDLLIVAGGDVILRDVVIRGDTDPRLDGSGGFVELAAVGNLTLDGAISLRSGIDGLGGNVFLDAGRNLVQSAETLVGGNGGHIEIRGRGSVAIEKPMSIENRGFGGLLEVRSETTLSISANLLDPGPAGEVGEIRLSGCRISLARDVKVDARATVQSALSLTSVQGIEFGRNVRLLATDDPVTFLHPAGAGPAIPGDVDIRPGWIGTVTNLDLPICIPPI